MRNCAEIRFNQINEKVPLPCQVASHLEFKLVKRHLNVHFRKVSLVNTLALSEGNKNIIIYELKNYNRIALNYI